MSFFMRPRIGEIQRGLSADKGSGVRGLRNVLGFGKMTTAILRCGKRHDGLPIKPRSTEGTGIPAKLGRGRAGYGDAHHN